MFKGTSFISQAFSDLQRAAFIHFFLISNLASSYTFNTLDLTWEHPLNSDFFLVHDREHYYTKDLVLSFDEQELLNYEILDILCATTSNLTNASSSTSFFYFDFNTCLFDEKINESTVVFNSQNSIPVFYNYSTLNRFFQKDVLR
jgi:hypothetical protein